MVTKVVVSMRTCSESNIVHFISLALQQGIEFLCHPTISPRDELVVQESVYLLQHTHLLICDVGEVRERGKWEH